MTADARRKVIEDDKKYRKYTAVRFMAVIWENINVDKQQPTLTPDEKKDAGRALQEQQKETDQRKERLVETNDK